MEVAWVHAKGAVKVVARGDAEVARVVVNKHAKRCVEIPAEEVVEYHAIIRANVMNAQIFAKVAVMEVVMVRVSHQLKAKIL